MKYILLTLMAFGSFGVFGTNLNIDKFAIECSGAFFVLTLVPENDERINFEVDMSKMAELMTQIYRSENAKGYLSTSDLMHLEADKIISDYKSDKNIVFKKFAGCLNFSREFVLTSQNIKSIPEILDSMKILPAETLINEWNQEQKDLVEVAFDVSLEQFEIFSKELKIDSIVELYKKLRNPYP